MQARSQNCPIHNSEDKIECLYRELIRLNCEQVAVAAEATAYLCFSSYVDVSVVMQQ
jgi:hypothetical protein